MTDTAPASGPAGGARAGARAGTGAGAGAGAESSIYDLGYRGYEGPRLGRSAAVIALITHSLRTAWGFGRSARSKVVPVGLLAFAVLPSLVALGVAAIFSQVGAAGQAHEALSPIRYSSLFPIMATLVMLFCASQAPELFGRDQRDGVLPLYFSRAISRLDYAAARTLGLLASLALIVLAPQLILLVGRVLAAPDVVAGLGPETESLPAILAVGSVMCVLLGTVAAAIASLSPRRSYATVAVIAVFVVPAIVAALLSELADGDIGRHAVLLSPGDILDGLNGFLFDVDPDSPVVERSELDGWVYALAAAAWIGGAVAVLVRRFRTVGS